MNSRIGKYYSSVSLQSNILPKYIIKVISSIASANKYWFVHYTYPELMDGWIAESSLKNWTLLTEAEALIESL